MILPAIHPAMPPMTPTLVVVVERAGRRQSSGPLDLRNRYTQSAINTGTTSGKYGELKYGELEYG
jgi:hypothetical protein